MPSNLLRNFPSVAELLETPQLKTLVDRVNHNVVVSRVRSMLEDLRSEVQSAAAEIKLPDVRELAERIARRILESEHVPLRPVINATGRLLADELGRAPLADEAIAELAAVARDYASLEVDLQSGEETDRGQAVETLLKELTGAEAALVVNNNAAATLLALATLAAGREVVVARSQLIEIGCYRLPEMIAASGARLREVGTTNGTRLEDYSQAIGDATGALLVVEASNFAVVGGADGVAINELARLTAPRQLPLIHDLGSAALVDLEPLAGLRQPLVKTSCLQGADLVLFSGDKLLGGPQCGVLVGRRALIARIGQHPLARVVRVGKLTLAALAATLRLYRDPAKARHSIPLLQLLGTPTANLKLRAERLAMQMAAHPAIKQAEAVEDASYLGSDPVPSQKLATWCIGLEPASGTAETLAHKFRAGRPAVLSRVAGRRVLLDLRSVFPRHDLDLMVAVRSLGGANPQQESQKSPENRPVEIP
jgi:L-seryl-tRNA(Ser) seleniumtransferase